MPSSVIKTYYYEKERQLLVVEFVSGVLYRYKEVPEEVFERMKQAFSKGIFFNRFIKEKYQCERISD